MFQLVFKFHDTQVARMTRIDNRTARRLWLTSLGLSDAPTGPLDVAAIVRNLGYVQLDTINILTRAHHHILWSRNQKYREKHLAPAMNPRRELFEHFTHDACVLPMEFLPVWQRQFERKAEKLGKSSWFSNMSDVQARADIKARIAREGALSTHDFDSENQRKGEAWSRPPHKMALDFMWYAGELATCHRRGFTKVYDLAERVYPEDLRTKSLPDEDRLNWLCQQALQRLAFANPGEIQRFWDTASAAEIREWLNASKPANAQFEGADGRWHDSFVTPDLEAKIDTLAAPTTRLRILSPFDPLIRDRARLKRLFGFDYRIEIFVPKAKRIWGYYVYPLLERDQFVGRIEARADRKTGILTVQNLWTENGIKWGQGRIARLEAELTRIMRLCDCKDIAWQCPKNPSQPSVIAI